MSLRAAHDAEESALWSRHRYLFHAPFLHAVEERVEWLIGSDGRRPWFHDVFDSGSRRMVARTDAAEHDMLLVDD